MNLWFVFALMTVAAVFAVLWPLGRRAAPQAGGSEASVYQDQLTEIDRDLAGGLIGAAEAEAARVEISRRLLATADRRRAIRPRSRTQDCAGSPPSSRCSGCRWRRSVFIFRLGRRSSAIFRSPSARVRRMSAQPLDNLVAQVEAHLEKNPTDGRGWSVLAPVLSRLGRYDDAVRAWRNLITYSGDSSERRADLGEALMAAAGGVVTGEAKAEFERAVAMNADEIKASYFLGLAAEQDGRARRRLRSGRRCWQRRRRTRRGVRWCRGAVRVGGPSVPALSADTMAAAKDMNEADRGDMIRGMVERLATRLKQNGDDVEGWLRLVRAYMVMGERDKAMSALTDARQAFANNAERLRQLNEGLKNLGLDG